ncbi:collagen alpha-2(I) chain-like [Dryobates pubescens]|uniref:collagen alpha-2(I) chain-like n=1 Tax=Dryobates pubescens TaxID=118200 RepID=UPI0023BA1BC9|nr:collagen alpha-2(I) chain-like [Dryobates pubescens]
MPTPGTDASTGAGFRCSAGAWRPVPGAGVSGPVPGAGPDAGSPPQWRCRCPVPVPGGGAGLAGPVPAGPCPAPAAITAPGGAGSEPAETPRAAMGQPRGLPALAMVALLVLAPSLADELTSTLDVALSAEGQTADPASPAKLEASGESDLTTSSQRLGKGLTSISFAPGGAATPQALGSDSSASLDPPESGSFSMEPPEGLRAGPSMDGPAQSNESEEGLEQDPDSEETLGSQGV